MQTKDERSRIIKMMVIGCQLADYAMRELIDGTKQDLKQRVKRVINSAKSVEDYLLHHPTTTPAIREIFEREFLKSETVLLAELMVTTWNLSEKDSEITIDKIKADIE